MSITVPKIVGPLDATSASVDGGGMDEAEQAPGTEDRLRTLWPDVPPDEVDLWNALSRTRREKVLQRLEALEQWGLEGEQAVGVEKVLRTAGVNLSTLYAIRQRWNERRSLDSLGVYVRKAVETPVAKPRRDEDLRSRIAQMLSAALDVSPAKVARDLAAEGITPAKTTLLRLIRSVRNDLPIGAPFGRMLVFDNAGADLVDMHDRRQRLCVVLDEDTGLVLGWAFVGEDDVARGYTAAAEHALIDHEGLQAREEVQGGLADLDFRGVEVYGHVHSATFVGPPFGDPTSDTGWRRLLDDQVHDPRFTRANLDEPLLVRDAVPGSRIVRAIGDRIGPIWIGTGLREPGIGYRTGRKADCALATYELQMQIGRALREHNLHVLNRMTRREDGWLDEGELSAIRSLLSIIAGKSSI